MGRSLDREPTAVHRVRARERKGGRERGRRRYFVFVFLFVFVLLFLIRDDSPTLGFPGIGWTEMLGISVCIYGAPEAMVPPRWPGFPRAHLSPGNYLAFSRSP
jgi:hypothetical protein